MPTITANNLRSELKALEEQVGKKLPGIVRRAFKRTEPEARKALLDENRYRLKKGDFFGKSKPLARIFNSAKAGVSTDRFAVGLSADPRLKINANRFLTKSQRSPEDQRGKKIRSRKRAPNPRARRRRVKGPKRRLIKLRVLKQGKPIAVPSSFVLKRAGNPLVRRVRSKIIARQFRNPAVALMTDQKIASRISDRMRTRFLKELNSAIEKAEFFQN